MSQPQAAPSAVALSPFVHEENGLFVAIVFESTFYGVTVLLYLLTVRNLFKKGRNRVSSTLWKLMTVLTIQQVALLLAIITNIQFCVLAFVYHRDTPGGPVAYQIMHSNVGPAYASLASFCVCNWLQDVVLVRCSSFHDPPLPPIFSQLYRFLVIYDGWYKLFAFPCAIFLTSLAFALILLVQLSGHAGLLVVGNNLPISTIYFSLSVGLNVIVTLLIVGRILYCARAATVSRTKLPKHYVSISAMITESAALSSVTGLVLIITLHTNFASSLAMLALYGVMTVLSPVLITYRVSTGEAWTRNTTEQTSVRSALTTIGGSRTALGPGRSGEDIILKSQDGGLESNPRIPLTVYHKNPQDEV